MAEGARLESVYTGNRIVGSNPTLSAMPFELLCFLLTRTFNPSWAAANGKLRIALASRPAQNGFPVEFKKDSVVIDVNGELQEIPNDFVWIFAGAILPMPSSKR